MIALVDYGIGNLRSVSKALTAAGAQVLLTSSPEEISQVEKIVLPGVGAFSDGMAGLKQRGLVEVILDAARRQVPLLGICLGMQLLFENSSEMGETEGLGLLKGSVLRFSDPVLKIPQTGWNQIEWSRAHPLLTGLSSGSYTYFNHSYYCQPSDPADCIAMTDYGGHYASITGRGRLYGVQFHPEKSQEIGIRILRNFLEYC